MRYIDRYIYPTIVLVLVARTTVCVCVRACVRKCLYI